MSGARRGNGVRLRKGKLIPRDDGKRIEEFVGAATTSTDSASVARMLAPPGWSEPAQRPEFDEVVIVLTGELTIVVEGRRERISAGEVGLVPRGKRVVYRNDGQGACDYWSVCAPAFRPELAHMETPKPRVQENHVTIQVAHGQGRDFARLLTTWARAYLVQLELSGVELSLSLVDDRAIRRLNRTWRKKDKATDVLSFPAGDLPKGTPGPRPLGDVVISLDTAKRQAKEYGRTLESEMARYLAHGLLHLLGHDHERPRDAKRMAALEEQLLGERGMVADSLQVDAKARRARSLM
ncbi:cupin domain protein [Myxococcus xanthus DK 1622]|uniref:Endoribonuclease YbeY n=1 Tax=Myxococcus xanthus (strain DK1622) TaxID=246197 RepID=YBEY_MYXXD|nr:MULTISPECIES: rRNA maturation RNase YbeY [Myxococcus]Q1D375.1 RecName: Full=Endoribonuclease YbeY [Myxococcus xanthus DK 1622]ABF89694.1 cupin domain protein [Myxococcus xanthus DK 1622]QPM77284.1 rRNA maturation RNase YbeY [Myxococcus xanthus]QVW66353.1 rRNA maturation RNase YbeY [Myxococcus xanthus DZ2]QZZ52410.1 Endoribonuclease YbeY [Myxococcus xanthus]UEO07520.1 rRNA maturation RNase YbeY [Myxococcus xanthus DZ2]